MEGKLGAPLVRRARLSDWEEASKMNLETYEGLDYLPSLYLTYFHLPIFSSYAVEVDGVLASFVAFEITEDGTIATAMASRVRPSYQGRGLSFEKNDKILKLLKSDYPKLTHQLYTTKVHQQSMSKVQKSDLFYRWKFVSYKLPLEHSDSLRVEFLSNESNIKSSMTFSDSREILTRTLGYTESMELLESGELESFLKKYTQRYLVFGPNWRPVPLDKTGIKLALLQNNLYISEEKCQKTSTNNPVSTRNIVALSFTMTIKCREFTYTDVFFYGSSTDHLKDHVEMQLGHGLAISEARYALNMHYPNSINDGEILKYFEKRLQVPRESDSFFYIECVLGMKEL